MDGLVGKKAELLRAPTGSAGGTDVINLMSFNLSD